jgi:hypothetical protein
MTVASRIGVVDIGVEVNNTHRGTQTMELAAGSNA